MKITLLYMYILAKLHSVPNLKPEINLIKLYSTSFLFQKQDFNCLINTQSFDID